jgi:hypothetical protein
MSLHFQHTLEEMGIWSATNGGFSFVISHGSRSGPGLHGRPGFIASWRPLHQNRSAIKIAGSPFESFADAEAACNAMLEHLQSAPTA